MIENKHRHMTVEMPDIKGLTWVIKLVRFVWLPIVLSVFGRWSSSALWVLMSSLIAFAMIQIGESDQSGVVLPEHIMNWLSQHDSSVLLCFWLIITTIVIINLIEAFVSWTFTWIHLVINRKVTPQVIETSITSNPDYKLDASTAVQRWLLKINIVYFLDEAIAATIGNIGSIVIAIYATYQANIAAGHISIVCLAVWILLAVPLTVKALRASKNAAQSHEIVGRTIRNSVALRMDLSRPSLLNFWLKKSTPSIQQLQQSIARQGVWNVILLSTLSTIASAIPYVAVIAAITTGNLAVSIAILLYLIRLSGPLGGLSKVLLWNHHNIISVQRIFNMLVKQNQPLNKETKQYAEIRSLKLHRWVVPVSDNNSITFPDIVASNEFILCIVGPSGSGKSTLLKSLAGLQEIKTGELQINDQVIDIKSSIWRETCGLLPQEPELIPDTIRDNLMDFADWSSTELIKKATDRIINSIESAEKCFVDIDNKGVSVGQRRCIALLRCLGSSSSVVLLDEPIAGIDDSLVCVLKDVIEDTRRQGRIVILTAHEHDYKRLQLEKGKIIKIK